MRYMPVRVSLVTVPVVSAAAELRNDVHFGVWFQFEDGGFGVFERSPVNGRVRVVSEQAFSNNERITVLESTSVPMRTRAIIERAEAQLGRVVDDGETFARRVYGEASAATSAAASLSKRHPGF